MTEPVPDAAELLREWERLDRHAPGTRDFRSRRISSVAVLDIRAAIRTIDGAPCLVIAEVPADERMRLSFFETAGVRFGLAQGEDDVLLVLSIEEREHLDLFAVLVADIVHAASASPDFTAALGDVGARLAAWRSFLRDRRVGLSRADVVGLIGELACMERLLAANRPAIEAWRSPEDGLHDFEWRGNAIEVKATLDPGGRRIGISTLDQLNDEGLASLALLHVLLAEDAAGSTLGDQVDRVSASIDNPRARRDFANALLRRGLLPDDVGSRSAPRVRVLEMRAYDVRAGIDRLVRRDVPLGITEASYSLDTRAIAPFSIGVDIAIARLPGLAED